MMRLRGRKGKWYSVFMAQSATARTRNLSKIYCPSVGIAAGVNRQQLAQFVRIKGETKVNAEMKSEADLIKDRTRQNWDAAATGWDKHTPAIRGWLQQPTAAMLNMAAVASGQTVLDLAAGAGDQTLDLAERVGPEGRVVASDISEKILAIAAQNASFAGYHNVETHLADAEP
jgi:16S rRNA C967 or C1407 C5-methylase (RsmB/RsmF family)